MIAALGILFATVAAPQVEDYEEAVRRILEFSLAEGRAHERLVELCTLAPHRLSGSDGAARAVAWAEGVLREDGLENVRLEPVMVPHWERGSVCEVAIDGGEALNAITLGGSPATPEAGISGTVVELHGVDEVDESVRGKIVFFNRPLDASLIDTFPAYGGAVDQRWKGPAEAATHGAVGALVRSMTTRLDDVPHTGATKSTRDAPSIPAVAISTMAAERLSRQLASGDEVVVRMRLDPSWHDDAPSHNVVAELVGRELPEEIVVVGGHLDGWDVGQGAHDDGAGCCQAMEALRILKELDLRPRRTLRVVLFMNEENGGRGAHAYREAHLDEMDRHVFALESDRGGFTPRGFTTNANPEALEILQRIGALLAPAGAGEIRPGRGGGADVDKMKGDGVVLAGFYPDPQRYFDLHHSARDTLEQISDREVNLGAGAMAALIYVVADLERTLPRNSRNP